MLLVELTHCRLLGAATQWQNCYRRYELSTTRQGAARYAVSRRRERQDSSPTRLGSTAHGEGNGSEAVGAWMGLDASSTVLT